MWGVADGKERTNQIFESWNSGLDHGKAALAGACIYFRFFAWPNGGHRRKIDISTALVQCTKISGEQDDDFL